jgi:hypothetical protein
MVRRAKSKNSYSLTRLRRTHSTARVLNLSLAFLNNKDSADYAAAPLFLNPRLNRSIFLKHTLRTSERETDFEGRSTVTKVVMPFEAEDLALGGFSFFLSDPELERNLSEQLEADYRSPAYKRDLKILRMLDMLPTFDPFLLRELLKRDGLSVAHCYFDLSERDTSQIKQFLQTDLQDEMRDYIQGEMGKIISLAFQNTGATEKQSSVLTEKLMSDASASSLDPLRVVLNLSGNDWNEGIFAWKGFLYYSWNIGAMNRYIPTLQREMLQTRVNEATRAELMDLQIIRNRVAGSLTKLYQVTSAGIQIYHNAYRDLIAGKPAAFRKFLKDAPHIFMEIGESFGMIMHICSTWKFLLSNRRQAWMSAEEAFDIFGEFDTQATAIIESHAANKQFRAQAPSWP